MKHAVRVLKTVVAVLAVAIPAVLVDPSFAHYVAQHPWAATVLTAGTALVRAVLSALQEQAGGTTASGAAKP